MPRSISGITDYLEEVLAGRNLDALAAKLAPKSPVERPLPPRVPGASLTSVESIKRRWRLVDPDGTIQKDLWDGHDGDVCSRNIENYIGRVDLPVGLAGPLRVNGMFANGDYYVPLATTEAALVASYHRGSLAISDAGGCTTLLLSESVSRAPGFVFRDMIEAGTFAAWATGRLEEFRREAGRTTSHGKLLDMQVTIEGNHVYLTFQFSTGDAAGQNMVTIATESICTWIVSQSPVKMQRHFVEANMSGDKKASALSFVTVRGRKVTAEVRLSADIIRNRLRTDAAAMIDYWRMSAMGGVMSGTIGVQGHYANGLAALYLATGQDAACVAESAVGVTRFEALPDEGLYAAVTLPNLLVGTVGGGTRMRAQNACLRVLRMEGDGRARPLAELATAVVLAGELSIIAALSAGHFASAHKKLARAPRGAPTG